MSDDLAGLVLVAAVVACVLTLAVVGLIFPAHPVKDSDDCTSEDPDHLRRR
jgi:hypothetical protein